jgi:hypothetical protein
MTRTSRPRRGQLAFFAVLLSSSGWLACSDESLGPDPFCTVCPACCASGGAGATGGSGGGGSSPSDTRWLLTAGDVGDQEAQSVAIDDDGNVYVAGYFEGTLTIGGQSLESPDGIDVFLAKLDPDGSPLWMMQLDETRQSYNDAAKLTVQARGNDVVLSGNFVGGILIGIGGSMPLSQIGGDENLFVAKLDESGALVWQQQFATSAPHPSVADLAIDAGGNVYITGHVAANSSGTLFSKPFTGASAWVAKLAASDGNPISAWEHVWPHTSSEVFAAGIGVTANGAAFVAGDFDRALTVDTTMPTTLTSAGQDQGDIFAVSIASDGSVQWARNYSDETGQKATDLALGPDGVFYVSGNLYGTIDFGGTSEPVVGDGIQAFDMFVAALDDAGDGIWADRFGDGQAQVVKAIASDGGPIVLGGAYQGNFDIGPAMLSGTDDSLYVAGLDPEGNGQWAITAGGPARQEVLAVDIGPDGEVAFCGEFGGTLELQSGDVENLGGKDLLVGIVDP